MPSAVVLFGATRRHSTVDDAQRESYLVLSPGYFLCRCRRVTPTHKPRDTGKEKEKNLLKDKKKKKRKITERFVSVTGFGFVAWVKFNLSNTGYENNCRLNCS